MSLFAFLWSWSDFVFASTLAGGGAHEPITLGIYHYIGNNNQQWNAIMATAVVASLPAAVHPRPGPALRRRRRHRRRRQGLTRPRARSRRAHRHRRDRRPPLAETSAASMTAAPSGPAFSVHDIPFSTDGSWFGISPVVAEKTYAEDLHLVSHQNGMHAVLRLVPLDAATGERPRPPSTRRRPCSSWTGADGRDRRSPTSRRTPCALRGTGLGLRVTAAAHDPDPVQRHLLLPRPGRRRARVHLVRDRPPLPRHRAVRHGRRRDRQPRRWAPPTAV